MTRFRRCVWLVGLVLLLPRAAGPAQAQGPQEGWQVYTNANYVNDLALEGGGALGGGYTWAATTGGVVCYSPSSQIKFTSLDGLASNWVTAIAADGGGRWWFGTYHGEVSILDDGRTPLDKGDDIWITFTSADGLTGGTISAITADGRGWWWFGMGSGVRVLDNGGTPFDKDDDTWNAFTIADGLPGHSVQVIAVDGGGHLWFGTSKGVSVLDHGGTPFYKGDDTWTTFTTADGLADNDVRSIAVDDEGRLWFGSQGGGASVLDHGGTPFNKIGDTWATFTTADGLAGSQVFAVATDGEERMWFGTWDGGASVLDHGGTPFDPGDDTWTTFSESDGLASHNVNAIDVDDEGRLWFGTWYGVSVLDYGSTPFGKGDDTWATLTTAGRLASDSVLAIAVDGGGHPWFGTDGGGVSVLDDGGTPFDERDGVWITFTTADGLRSDFVKAIFADGSRRWWFGTATGVSMLDDGGTPFDKRDDTWASFTTADGLADGWGEAIAADSGGRLWFGTYEVSVLDDGGTPFDKRDDTWTTFTTADGLAANWVRAIAVDGGGCLWFGTSDGVSVLDHGGTPFDKRDDTWTTFATADGLVYDSVYAITLDDAGRLWFGTSNGVSVLDHGGTPFDKEDDSWTTFTTADGLASTIVMAIATDSGGHVWFSTYGGIAALDDGGTPFDKRDDAWTTFTTADGLADRYVYAMAGDSRGQWWFGTLAGVSELVDAVAPVSSAHSPAYANGKVSVPWSASDGASHIFRVTLWVRYGSSGAWTSTGLSQRGQSTGTFTYTPTYGDGTYSFATIAEDWMGNVEASPAGRGDCSTCVGRCYVYLPVVLRNYRTWDAYYEENDHWLDAYGPLASGKVYLAYPNDVEDYYYFVLSASATVNVSVTDFAPTSSNGTVMLYGPAVGSERGNLIEYYGPPGDSSMSLGPHLLGPGKYYVRVNTAKGYSTTQLYRLTVTY